MTTHDPIPSGGGDDSLENALREVFENSEDAIRFSASLGGETDANHEDTLQIANEAIVLDFIRDKVDIIDDIIDFLDQDGGIQTCIAAARQVIQLARGLPRQEVRDLGAIRLISLLNQIATIAVAMDQPESVMSKKELQEQILTAPDLTSEDQDALLSFVELVRTDEGFDLSNPDTSLQGVEDIQHEHAKTENSIEKGSEARRLFDLAFREYSIEPEDQGYDRLRKSLSMTVTFGWADFSFFSEEELDSTLEELGIPRDEYEAKILEIKNTLGLDL